MLITEIIPAILNLESTLEGSFVFNKLIFFQKLLPIISKPNKYLSIL